MEKIERIFEKYGPLENVELRRAGPLSWAYITFFNDKDACFALNMEEKGKRNEIFANVLPAWTWKQPLCDQISTDDHDTLPNVNESSLMVLNDDCLEHIFHFCDMSTLANIFHVCQRTRDLIERFVRPKVAQYEINFQCGQPRKSLKRVHDELKNFGPYVKTLRVAEMERNIDNSPTYFSRYLDQCNKYVGASLRELQLHQIPSLCPLSRKIQSLLNKIESLEFGAGTKNHAPFDVPLSPENFDMPKLKELSLNMSTSYNFDNVFALLHLLENDFPHLEKLATRFVLREPLLETFLINNVQLKCLHIQTYVTRTLLPLISRVSINLEELIIHGRSFSDKHGILLVLPCIENNKLSKLMLHSGNFENSKYALGLLADVQKLKALRSIMLTGFHPTYDQNICDAIVDLSGEIPHLEHFCTDASLDRITIAEFIARARHLKTFCVAQHGSVCPVTLDFIKSLVAIRRRQFENQFDEIVVLNLILYPSLDEMQRVCVNRKFHKHIIMKNT